jgi:hypothetical protein
VNESGEDCSMANRPRPRRPLWKPEGLALGGDELRKLSYVVVDEIVEDAARLSVSSWPRVDEQGRLHFERSERARSVRADMKELGRFVSAHRADRRRAAPRLRMGTVLAAGVDLSVLPEPESDEEMQEQAQPEPRPPGAWMQPPVYDISSDARDKAKEAFYAAVAPTVRSAGGKS